MKTKKSPFVHLLLAVALIALLTPVQAAAETGGSGGAGATATETGGSGSGVTTSSQAAGGGEGANATGAGGAGSGVSVPVQSSSGGGGAGAVAPAPAQASTAPIALVQAGGEAAATRTPCPSPAPPAHPPGAPWYGCEPSGSGGGMKGMMGGMGGMQGMMGGPPGPPVVEQHNIRPQFQTLALTGMGVAIPAGNPSDVHIVRVGIATVHIVVLDEPQEVTVGMLIYDDTRYSLREVTLSPERIGATVYQKDQKVGTLTLTSTRRAGFEVWSGEVTLSGTRHNTYILQPPRPPTPDEAGADARRFCESNPNGCKGIAPSACDPAEPGCRAEIERYCAANPSEIRCIALQKGHCGNNSQDVRCRNVEIPAAVARELTAFCQQKPDLCSGLGTTREEVLKNCASSSRPDRCQALIKAYCAAYPADAGCQGKPEGPPFGPSGGSGGLPGAPGGPGGQPGVPGQGHGGQGRASSGQGPVGQGQGLESRGQRAGAPSPAPLPSGFSVQDEIIGTASATARIVPENQTNTTP